MSPPIDCQECPWDVPAREASARRAAMATIPEGLRFFMRGTTSSSSSGPPSNPRAGGESLRLSRRKRSGAEWVVAVDFGSDAGCGG